MTHRDTLFTMAALMCLWPTAGRTWADDPKVDADKRPRLVPQLGHPMPVFCVAISPNGKHLLTGSGDGTAKLWDVSTAQEIRTFAGPPGSGAYAVAFSPDGKQILTGSDDKTARLWDAQSGKGLITFTGHTGGITSVAFTPDGKRVLTGSADKTLRLWDARTGKQTGTLEGHTGEVRSVAFSADGKQVLTASVDGTARLWDEDMRKNARVFTANSPPIIPFAVFSPDGKHILTPGKDYAARLLDARTGNEVRTFSGHSFFISAAAFSPDGTRVLTASMDGMTTVWNTETGKALCTLIGLVTEDRVGGPPSLDTWAVVDSEGRFDASNGGDVEGLHWVVGNEPIALKQLKQRYYDPGLLAKVMGFNKEPLRDVAAFAGVKLHPEVAVSEIKPGDKTLTLNLTNRGGGIGRVQVFVNGKELLADARGPKPNADAKQSTLTVDLAGVHAIAGKPNKVEVVAWNAEGYLSGRGLELDWTPDGRADPNPPELYIIACGVSAYADPKLNLRYAAKDAEDMARALELAGKRFLGADKVHLTLLSTGNDPKAQKPTKENIRKAFEAVRKSKPTDILVVYLAGHGVSLRQGGDEYCYLTADARSTDPRDLADPAVLGLSMVTSSELVDWIKLIPALKQVMALDTCAAGAAKAKLLEHRDLSGDQVRALDRLKDRTGFHVLMGCAADRVSYEASEYSQGLLTYALLKGMAGAKLREGEYVDVSGLFQYAADEVPQLARGIGLQKPMVMAPRGTSFDIGKLVEADRKAILLAKPKPFILRPQLSNAADGDDDLKLASLVGKRLADDSGTARGAPVSAVYVDADELAGAVRATGQYTVAGTKVSVRLVLKRDGQTLTKATIDGTTDDLPGLAVKIAEAIRQGVKKP